MRNMGLDFKAPPQTDLKQWRKVETLFQHGFTCHSCGCGGPGYRPATLKEVPAFLEKQKQEQSEWKRQQENAAKARDRDKIRSEKRWAQAARFAAKTNPA